MSIVAENIVKEYKRRGKSFIAVDNASFTVPKGRIVAVTGRSGSGKSTLLNILAGMIEPEKGSVNVDDINIFGVKASKRDKLRAGKIGIIPQNQSLISGLTIYDNIRLQSIFLSQRPFLPNSSFSGMVSALGIDDLLSMYPANLSGGEMKRVAIARTLSGNFDYIFADEPTGELDKQNSEKVMTLFRKEASDGKGILVITHDDLVSQSADIIYTMEDGRLKREK